MLAACQEITLKNITKSESSRSDSNIDNQISISDIVFETLLLSLEKTIKISQSVKIDQKFCFIGHIPQYFKLHDLLW